MPLRSETAFLFWTQFGHASVFIARCGAFHGESKPSNIGAHLMPFTFFLHPDRHVLLLRFANILPYYPAFEQSKSRPANQNRSFLGVSTFRLP